SFHENALRAPIERAWVGYRPRGLPWTRVAPHILKEASRRPDGRRGSMSGGREAAVPGAFQPVFLGISAPPSRPCASRSHLAGNESERMQVPQMVGRSLDEPIARSRRRTGAEEQRP